MERSANITKVVALGNTIKLPGLQQYLAKSLNLPVDRVNSYEHLVGAEVTAAPSFEDNVPSFAVCYGLVLQGLGLGRLSTNLVPREVVVARTIRRKKPWALACVAATLAALAFSFAFSIGRLKESDPDHYSAPMGELASIKTTSGEYQSTQESQKSTLALLKQLGHEVVDMAEGRMLALEMIKIINDALPREDGTDPMSVSQIPITENRRPQIHVEKWEMKYFSDLGEWYTDEAKTRYGQGMVFTDDVTGRPKASGDDVAEAAAEDVPAEADSAEVADAGADPSDPVATDPASLDPSGMEGDDTEGTEDTGVDLTGKAGWVVELECIHYNNDISGDGLILGEQYVRNSLLYNLRPDRKITVPVPGDTNNPFQDFTLKQIGVCNPLIATRNEILPEEIDNPNWTPPIDEELTEEEMGMPAGPYGRPRRRQQPEEKPKKNEKDNPKKFKQLAYKFSVQFAWIPRRFAERSEPLDGTGADAMADPTAMAAN